MKKKITLLLYSLAALVLASCADERLWDPEDIVGDGEANVQGSITFKNYAPALDGASRADGTAIDGVNSLIIYIYDKNGDLVTHKAYGVGNGDGQLKPSVNTQKPAGSVGVSEPVSTTKVDFNFSLKYGYYKIYAVANADMTDKDVSTESKLQEVAFRWQTDITKNNQMFGWFTTADPTAVSALNFDENGRINAELVKVNKTNLHLNAWLTRLASKVTVAYDATGLKENVYIYLKSVQIKDIPKECALGISNKPDSNDDIEDGEIIYYYDTSEYPSTGPLTSDFNVETYKAVLTHGKKFYGSNHTHDADSTLFFFENNQGKGKNKGQDVIINGTENLPDGNFGTSGSDGKIDFPDGNDSSPNTGYKDEKRYGTYIEVKAYYVSVDNGEHSGQGNITYRFMLGKDTDTDYNATRNYHYKLTLQFNGYANDVDWHIDYEQEKRQIESPNPYYISYLYNHSMMLPMTIITGSATITELNAEIVSNGWAPVGAESSYNGTIDDSNKASLYDKYYLYYSGADYPTQYPWNGFLSLRKTEETNITVPGMTDWTIDSNKSYYLNSDRGKITYNGNDLKASGDDVTVRDALFDGKLHVAIDKDKEGNNVYNINMPLWTRAKNLISQTAYTGNNPYVAYRREAKVKITAKLSDGNKLSTGLSTNPNEHNSDNIAIQQVRRVVNPKGIWRRGDNNKSFDVDLMILPTEESNKFESLTSTGPWRAYVFRDTKRGEGNETGWDDSKGTIRLVGNTRTTTGTVTVKDKNGKTREYQTIEGATGSNMRFRVEFNGTTHDDDPNYAIIRIEYQNYTCYHLIFVRQGYGADAIVEGGKQWYTSNNVLKAKLADSPLDEGSMFKFAQWWYPISSSNNINNKPYWTRVTPNDFSKNAAGSKKLELVGASNTDWASIPGYDVSNADNKFGDPEGMHVATYDDYMEFKRDGIEQGFGVLYGDDSDKCLTDINDVYGYLSSDENKNRGMRGCFVYDYDTGKNLFFPIGASGYGHRKDLLTVGSTNYRGVLRYSSNNRWGYFDAVKNETGQGYTEGVKGAPLFFDIFRRPGGIYWFKQLNGTFCAWDINYFSFDFGPLHHVNLQSKLGSDAVYIRCVKN